VTGVRLSQGNTGQPTLYKKFGTSHTKTIKNGFDMESRINYVSFYEKKFQKTFAKYFLNHFEVFNPTGLTPYYGTYSIFNNNKKPTAS
jgi:hypothetical protein